MSGECECESGEGEVQSDNPNSERVLLSTQTRYFLTKVPILFQEG